MKKRLIFTLLFSSNAMAADINTATLQACSKIENDFNRLICYDNEIKGETPSSKQVSSVAHNKPVALEKEVVVTKKPQTLTPNKELNKSKGSDDFGLEHKDFSEKNENELTASLTKIKKAPRGELILTLDNGQVWRQIGNDHYRIKEQDKIIISRGIFNSFMLGTADRNKKIRVKRIK